MPGVFAAAGHGAALPQALEPARQALHQVPDCLPVAADFTVEMMLAGKRRPPANLSWAAADALYLPFPGECFDAVVSGFLLRNVGDIHQALCEQHRVLKPGGRIVALDTTRNLLHNSGIASSIEFRSEHAIPEESLRDLSGVDAVFAENGAYFLTVSKPQHALDGLFTASRRQGFGINELMLKRATLEDVFLKLTGHQLRD